MHPELYFEDLVVGRRFVSPEERVTAALLEPFARTVGAAASGVLSPSQLVALSMRLLLQSPFRTAGGTLGAGVEGLSWPEPARIGDVLRVELEVVQVRRSRSRPDRGLVTTQNRTLTSAGSVVQVNAPTIIIPVRDPA